MLAQKEIDAYANKAILFEMSDRISDTRILDGYWGLEHIALAIPPGRDAGMAYLREFLVDAKSSGLDCAASLRIKHGRAEKRGAFRGITKAISEGFRDQAHNRAIFLTAAQDR